jgi:hypothetical protein
MMREARRATRVAARHQGIVRVTGRPETGCSIRNISNFGASLTFPHPTILPRTFDLSFSGQAQRVTLVWQSGRLAGVKFQTPMAGLSGPEKRRTWPWSKAAN